MIWERAFDSADGGGRQLGKFIESQNHQVRFGDE
jgi:hypothetical protein